MPIYEYRCGDCRRKVALFVKGFSQVSEAVCTGCGSKNLTRLFSTFARLKTDKDVYDDILGDTQLVNRMMANDPSALVEWSRKMEGSEAEKDSEFGDVIERMQRGEGLDSIAAEMGEGEADSLEGSDWEE